MEDDQDLKEPIEGSSEIAPKFRFGAQQEEALKAANDLGYKRNEMKNIRQEVCRKHREWVSLFDDLMKMMVHDSGSAADVLLIVKKAEILADARMEVVLRKAEELGIFDED